MTTIMAILQFFNIFRHIKLWVYGKELKKYLDNPNAIAAEYEKGETVKPVVMMAKVLTEQRAIGSIVDIKAEATHLYESTSNQSEYLGQYVARVAEFEERRILGHGLEEHWDRLVELRELSSVVSVEALLNLLNLYTEGQLLPPSFAREAVIVLGPTGIRVMNINDFAWEEEDGYPAVVVTQFDDHIRLIIDNEINYKDNTYNGLSLKVVPSEAYTSRTWHGRGK